VGIMPDRFNSTSAPQVAGSATGGNGLTTTCKPDPWAEVEALRAENARLRSIVEFAGAREFLVATVAEAGYQRVLWGDGPKAAPTAWGSNADMDWVGLIAALAGKAAGTDPADIDKKLHRITTCAAAAANWHQRVKESGDQ
jgi:hypothetical protein